MSYALDGVVQRVENLVLVEPQDGEPQSGQARVTVRIGGRALAMVRAVYFHDQPGWQAYEVDDPPPDDVLPPEPPAVQLPSTQARP